jgi:hypothetical protein
MLGSLGGSLMTYPLLYFIYGIEEGRAASKSPHYKFGCFLSMSQQAVSADTIPNSAVGIFSLKTEGTKTKAARVHDKVVTTQFRYFLFCPLSNFKIQQ